MLLKDELVTINYIGRTYGVIMLQKKKQIHIIIMKPIRILSLIG